MSEINQKRLRFHLDSEDYFVTLATILNMVASEMERLDAAAARKAGVDCLFLRHCLLEAKDELVFLQKHFRIEPKSR